MNFLAGADKVFSNKKAEEKANNDQDNEFLYSKIGRLQTEVDFLKKVLGKWVWIKNDIWFDVKTLL